VSGGPRRSPTSAPTDQGVQNFRTPRASSSTTIGADGLHKMRREESRKINPRSEERGSNLESITAQESRDDQFLIFDTADLPPGVPRPVI
jgi:hypothetical protein